MNAFVNGDFNDKEQKIFFKTTKRIGKYDDFDVYSEQIKSNYIDRYENHFECTVEKVNSDPQTFILNSFYNYSDLKIKNEKEFLELLDLLHYNDHDKINNALINSILVRGSKDPTTGYISIDWKKKKNNKEQIIILMGLLNKFSNIHMYNLNYRELQENSKSKNTQLRIIAKYAVETLGDEFFDIEKKKSIIRYYNFEKNIKSQNFWKKYEEYLSLITVEKDDLHDEFINEFRKKYGMNINEEIVSRSFKLKELAAKTLPDICYGCENKYNLDMRTFKFRNSNKYYLEIHHVIPWSLNKEKNDDLSNLVKLCPACHRALTKNRADEILQREIIENIIIHSNSIGNFIENNYPNNNEELVDFVYDSLN
jgi:predicted HNH restriction endonuclease